MMHTTKSTSAARFPVTSWARVRPEAVPLPRRWARAKKWSQGRAAGPPDVEHIKLMLDAERANRG